MSKFTFTNEEVAAWTEKHKIPDYMREGIRHYLVEHEETGDFLRAVFENDLVEAIKRADDTNRQHLRSYCALLYWELPGRGQEGSPWGSAKAYKDWVKQ